MRYQGGKSRIARPIVETIRRMHPSATEIWEPFCGGAAMTLALAKAGLKVHASDIHPDLILMWQAVMVGDAAVSVDVSEDDYALWRNAPVSARRGFVGFGASFGGGWFAGFGRGANPNPPQVECRNFFGKLAKFSALVDFSCHGYEITPSDVLVYADIPYQGTKVYNRSVFDHAAFWQWVRERRGPTFVSELAGPDDMQVVWRKAHKSQMTSNSPTSAPTSSIVHREERLYYWPGHQP